jgi:galactokinase
MRTSSGQRGRADVERSFRAPGRVNLIGEHTDYSGGLVLPAAIELGVTVIGEAGGDTIELVSDRSPEPVVVAADGTGAAPGWGRYVSAVAAELAAAGRGPVGFTGRVVADLPPGAGLSSSAALEVGVALALCAAAAFEPARLELAEICRRAEEHAVGVPCGLLDQAASLLGRRGHALFLDCATREHRHVPFPADLELLVVDSGVARRLEESGYARRRAEVEAGDPRRLRHVRTENERVREVVAALEAGDRAVLRTAFAASHASLRDDFEVSTPELNRLVGAALEAGAIAARLTGAGFGGSIVALVETGTGTDVGASLGGPFHVSRPEGPAGELPWIRPARSEEARTLSGLVDRAYGHYVERIGRRPAPMDDDYDALAAAGEVWVLEGDGIAGLVVLRAVDDHLLVDNVAVSPERQGAGLGRALLDFAEAEARRRGIPELRLYTNAAMTENIALYRRLGWQEYDRRLEGAYARVYFRKPV